MSEKKKLSEKFLEVLKHEGVVSITSWGVENSRCQYLELIFSSY